MTATYTKTINLAPRVKAVGASTPEADGMPSAIATLSIVLVIWLVATLTKSDEIPVAQAQVVDTARPAVSETPLNDPITVALLRADGWVPWDQLAADLLIHFGDSQILEELNYKRGTSSVQLRGRAQSVNQIPELMLILEQHTWLKDIKSVRAVLDPKSGLSLFTLQATVEPPLQLKPLVPGLMQ